MKKQIKLQSRLKTYGSSARTEATRATLRQRMGNWPMYAAATGSALAMATTASAGIISFTGAPLTTTAAIPDGATMWGVRASEHFQIGSVPGSFEIAAQDLLNRSQRIGAAAFGMGSYSGRIAKTVLSAGVAVNSTLPFYGPDVQLRFKGSSFTFGGRRDTGLLQLGVPGCFGFRTSLGDFGWAELEVNADRDGFANSVTLLAAAYDDTGAPILTGDTGESATPEPGTAGLALLALGAAGVTALRRRGKQ